MNVLVIDFLTALCVIGAASFANDLKFQPLLDAIIESTGHGYAPGTRNFTVVSLHLQLMCLLSIHVLLVPVLDSSIELSS